LRDSSVRSMLCSTDALPAPWVLSTRLRGMPVSASRVTIPSRKEFGAPLRGSRSRVHPKTAALCSRSYGTNGLRCAPAHMPFFHCCFSKGLRPSRSQGIQTRPAASPRLPARAGSLGGPSACRVRSLCESSVSLTDSGAAATPGCPDADIGTQRSSANSARVGGNANSFN
jgi:hypothetical protein